MNDIATQIWNNRPICTCPHCDSSSLIRSGFDRGTQRYKCKNCQKTFKATAGTPVHGIHKKQKIQKYIESLQQGMSVRKAAIQTGISKNSSFTWRHKFLSSLETRTIVNEAGKIATADIIKLKYSAKGRKKEAEKHCTPSKTIVLLKNRQLELHKLPPIKQVRHTAEIFTKNRSSYFAVKANKTITSGIMHSPAAIKIKDKHITEPLKTQVKQNIQKLQDWMQRFRGVATKYLQQYWNWYTTLNNLVELKTENNQFCKLCTTQRSLNKYQKLKAI